MKTLKIIKSEKDYQDALDHVEALMDKKALTKKESDELELWGTLVSIYEDKKWPIAFPSPLEAIRFRMDQMGLSQRDLEKYIGSKSKVSEVLSGKRSLSKQMIFNLHKGLGIPLESLISDADLPGENISTAQQLINWLKFPVAEMIKRKWVQETVVKKDSQSYMRVMKAFAFGLDHDILTPAMLKTGSSSRQCFDPYALTAWRIRVLALAKKEKMSTEFDPCILTRSYREELSKLSYLEEGPRLAGEFLNKSGIHLIVEKHLPHTYLDGASMFLASGAPIIAMTLRYDRLDNFWFVLFHELAHLALHLSRDNSKYYLENFDQIGTDTEEKEADKWAMESLIPDHIWKEANLSALSSYLDILNFAKRMRINPAIPAGRLRRETRDYALFSQLVGNNKVRALFNTKAS
ncbi:MAG TPA: ImmA/IrrE family metallo-endopeptidase [Smithellaceae bacterium]|nr:ImmA/IrrE family metallo-endopeptidase [Smithellaceae bacterium]